jgi:pyruvate/2-oxoglutarate dehydrogenase complex dihydrolipoamide dehydrogenase (E3) component
VVPAPEPAQIFGLETGIKGAIKTDQYCQTSVDSIYAAGDCTESKSIYTRRPVLFQLAVNAVPCGKIAGYNAAVSVIAPKKAYPGTMLTTNSYFFGLEIASAGLSTMHDLVNHMKDRAGRLPESTVFDPSKYALHSETLPLKPFLDSRPDNHTITVSIVFHKKTGRIAGASFIAPHSACLRADLLAALMSGKTPLENTSYHTSSPVSGLTLEDLADIETGYTPSVRPFNDPLSITARAAALALENSGVARDTALNHPDTDSFLSLSRLN